MILYNQQYKQKYDMPWKKNWTPLFKTTEE